MDWTSRYFGILDRIEIGVKFFKLLDIITIASNEAIEYITTPTWRSKDIQILPF